MKAQIVIKKLQSADKDFIVKIGDWYQKEWSTPFEKTIKRLSNQPDEETLFQAILTINNQLVATGGLCNQVNIFNQHPQLRIFRPWLALLYRTGPPKR